MDAQKYMEMVDLIKEVFGENTPNRSVQELERLIEAIKNYEKAGPIDILNGEKVEDKKRLNSLGKLSREIELAILMIDACISHYGISKPGLYHQMENMFKNNDIVSLVETGKDNG